MLTLLSVPWFKRLLLDAHMHGTLCRHTLLFLLLNLFLLFLLVGVVIKVHVVPREVLDSNHYYPLL